MPLFLKDAAGAVSLSFPTIAEQSIRDPDGCGGLPHYGSALTAFVSIVIPGSMVSVFSILNPTSCKTRST
jgi:hypothetical protein